MFGQAGSRWELVRAIVCLLPSIHSVNARETDDGGKVNSYPSGLQTLCATTLNCHVRYAHGAVVACL